MTLVCHCQIDLSHGLAIVHCQDQLRKGHGNVLMMSQLGSMGATTHGQTSLNHVTLAGSWFVDPVFPWGLLADSGDRKEWAVRNIGRMYKR